MSRLLPLALWVLTAGCPASTSSLENTAARCDDGLDNDVDGNVDCDDQDCWVFAFCDMGPECGDGVVDPGEECDEGLFNGNGTCTTECLLVSAFDCGNGVIDAGEECDQGAMNSDSEPDRCRVDCTNPICGDGVADSSEECDDGPANSNTDPDACRTDCMAAFCGDAVVDMGEGCDNGKLNSDTAPDTCRTNCQPPSCGDAVVDILAGEGCDDGAMNGMPGFCSATCTPPGCGDGVFDPATELCDAGNTGTLTCMDFAFIGGTLACNPDCSIDVSGCDQCGNSIIEGSEDCDGAALGGETCMTITGAPGTLACGPTCAWDTSGCMACGNGVVDPGEECDGPNLAGEDCTTVPGGFGGGTLACDAGCLFDTSSCTPGMCDPTNPSTYASTPTVIYQCAFDPIFGGNPQVDLSITDWILVDLGGGMISVTGVSSHFGAMTGSLSPFDCSGTFSVSTVVGGDCDEYYQLDGTFTGPNTWTGMLTLTFVDAGLSCATYFMCFDQLFPVSGTRP